MTEVRSTLITTDIQQRRVFKYGAKYTAEDEAILCNLNLPTSSRLEAVASTDGYAEDSEEYVSVFLRLPLPQGCPDSYSMYHVGYLR
jgi:hypothetical protein